MYKQGCEHFTALKPFHRPILQTYDIQKLPSADASMRMLYIVLDLIRTPTRQIVQRIKTLEVGDMTHDNT